MNPKDYQESQRKSLTVFYDETTVHVPEIIYKIRCLTGGYSLQKQTLKAQTKYPKSIVWRILASTEEEA
jgi:hypothetical protein